MKKRWKILIGVLVGLLVIAGLVGGFFAHWYYADKSKYENMVAKKTDVPMWEADPKPLTTEDDYLSGLTNAMQKNGDGFDIKGAAKNSVVIPGLRGAWSIDHKTKEPDFGTDWVPQGVTQNAKNYYVSMYDGDKNLNSIIVQIDKATKNYKRALAR